MLKQHIKMAATVFLLLLLTTIIFRDQPPKEEETIISEPTPVLRIVDAKHLKCLATGIYYEAGGESTMGQIAVARVIMNRVLHGFANNPCGVVYQTHSFKTSDGESVKTCQFSWVCDGKTTPSPNNPRFKKAVSIATQVLEQDKWNDVLPNNTLFFHNITVAPRWAYKQVTKIGNHVFYSKGKEKKTDNASN